MICLGLEKIVMNLYRNLLQKCVSKPFFKKADAIYIYNKVHALFCLCRICVVDKNRDNNYITSENKLLKIERLVYTF